MIIQNNAFHNSHKEFIGALRSILPTDVFVGSRIPASRHGKMVIVFDAGGPPLGDIRRSQRLNVMIFGGKSWEETADFAYEIDEKINSLDGRPFSKIISIRTAFYPTPSPLGEDTETPVYSIGYDLVVVSKR